MISCVMLGKKISMIITSWKSVTNAGKVQIKYGPKKNISLREARVFCYIRPMYFESNVFMVFFAVKVDVRL